MPRKENDIYSRLDSLYMLAEQLKERWQGDRKVLIFPPEIRYLIDCLSQILKWPGLGDRILRTPPSFQTQFETAMDSLKQSLSLGGYQSPNQDLISQIVSEISMLSSFFDFIARRTYSDDETLSEFQELNRSLKETLKMIDSKYKSQPIDHRTRVESAGQREDLALLKAQLDTSETKRRIAEEKAAQARQQTENLSHRIGQLMSVVEELERKVADDVETRTSIDSMIASAKRNVEEISQIKKSAELLSSEAADNVMSGNYGKLAVDHEASELRFRVAAMILFGVAALGAAFIAWNVGWFGDSQGDDSIWLSLVKKISVSLGIAGIGLYCSRLATHHRRLAVWSKSLGVQLKTLESYLAGISDDRLKDGIRERFAKLTFSGPPDTAVPSSVRDDERVISAIAGAVANSLRKE